jgi:hypothetical protein
MWPYTTSKTHLWKKCHTHLSLSLSLSPFIPDPHGILSAVDTRNSLAISHAAWRGGWQISVNIIDSIGYHATRHTMKPPPSKMDMMESASCIAYTCSGALTASNVKRFYDLDLIMCRPRQAIFGKNKKQWEQRAVPTWSNIVSYNHINIYGSAADKEVMPPPTKRTTSHSRNRFHLSSCLCNLQAPAKSFISPNHC